MVCKSFYESYKDYSHLLICQTDALVFSDEILKWINYDYSYIGAPWFVGMDKPVKPLNFLGVGNGGLSMREIEVFINVLSNPIKTCIDEFMKHCIKKSIVNFLTKKFLFYYRYKFKNSDLNEDYFWGVVVPEYFEYFKVPDPLIAADFSFEVQPEYLYKIKNMKLPFGCHAWERYEKNFWLNIFNKHGINLPGQ
jgi:hypothetical protein